MTESLTASYFDGLYRQSCDPWSLATRAYEARKYAITIACLPRPHYDRVFEPGCSVGVLTERLAPVAGHLLAWDASAAAIAEARRRVPAGNVDLQVASVHDQWPDGTFDLIVFSELGYYFGPEDLDRFVLRASECLEPGGHLVAVHWRPDVPDYPGTAEAVHARLNEQAGLARLARYEDRHFLLEVFASGCDGEIRGPED